MRIKIEGHVVGARTSLGSEEVVPCLVEPPPPPPRDGPTRLACLTSCRRFSTVDMRVCHSARSAPASARISAFINRTMRCASSMLDSATASSEGGQIPIRTSYYGRRRPARGRGRRPVRPHGSSIRPPTLSQRRRTNHSIDDHLGTGYHHCNTTRFATNVVFVPTTRQYLFHNGIQQQLLVCQQPAEDIVHECRVASSLLRGMFSRHRSSQWIDRYVI